MPRVQSKCKQEGYDMRKYIPVEQNHAIITTPVDSVTNMTDEHIEIPDNSIALWGALASQDYDHFQPFVELIDNGIAAIISALATGMIYIVFNFETNVGSIEHSGGNTFPLDKRELARCFMYGGKYATRLNEHGCGLKSSLAILDPHNKHWKIYIKYVENGMLRVKSISAPYSNRLVLRDESEWPGANKTAENGTYIQFPIDKTRFSDLYQKKTGALMNDLHDRIQCHFTHMWMKLDELIDGKLQMHYNGTKLIPFSFGSENMVDFISHKNHDEFTLSTGAHVKVQQVILNDKASSRKGLPGSHKFKRAMSANGAYLYKNGRFIESINTDDTSRGNLYCKIFGSVPDNHHNGNILIVNMIGEQRQLPPTVPTKNRFQGSLLFDEFIEKLNKCEKITKPGKSEVEKEVTLVEDYIRREENSLRRRNPSITFEKERSYKLHDGESRAPPIDLVITIGNERDLIEFKRSTLPSKDDIGQLLTNWILAKDSPENIGKVLKPILIVRAAKGDDLKIGDNLRCYLTVLAAPPYEFRPTILNTDNVVLWPLA